MERAMMEPARDMGSVHEKNPRQMAAITRRLSDASGESLGPEMDEMIRRLEAGEDPEDVEEAIAGAVEEEGFGDSRGTPAYDDGSHDL